VRTPGQQRPGQLATESPLRQQRPRQQTAESPPRQQHPRHSAPTQSNTLKNPHHDARDRLHIITDLARLGVGTEGMSGEADDVKPKGGGH